MLQLHDFSDLVLDEGVAEPDRQALVEDLQRHPRRAQCPVSVPVSVPCFSAPFQCPVSVPVSVPLCPLSRPPQCARLKKARGKARCEPLRAPTRWLRHAACGAVRPKEMAWRCSRQGSRQGRSSLQCRTAHHGDGANQKRHGMQVDWTGLIISLVAGSSHHETHAPSRSRRDSHRATKEMACRWIRQG